MAIYYILHFIFAASIDGKAHPGVVLGHTWGLSLQLVTIEGPWTVMNLDYLCLDITDLQKQDCDTQEVK